MGESSGEDRFNREEQFVGPPVLVRCKNWEDFKSLASGAVTVSFLCNPEEKTFQVCALKDGKIYTFNGEIPDFSSLLRVWVSEELGVQKKRVLEGILAVG